MFLVHTWTCKCRGTHFLHSSVVVTWSWAVPVSLTFPGRFSVYAQRSHTGFVVAVKITMIAVYDMCQAEDRGEFNWYIFFLFYPTGTRLWELTDKSKLFFFFYLHEPCIVWVVWLSHRCLKDTTQNAPAIHRKAFILVIPSAGEWLHMRVWRSTSVTSHEIFSWQTQWSHWGAQLLPCRCVPADCSERRSFIISACLFPCWSF